MRYKAVLLDFYGTLVEEDDAIVGRLIHRLAAASPLDPEPHAIGQFWSQQFTALCTAAYGAAFKSQRQLEVESLQTVLEVYQVKLDPVALAEELFAYWRAPQVCADTHRFLTAVSLPLCMVSNIDTMDLEGAIQHHGWRFDALITSEHCRAYKPRPEVFRAALERVGLAPDQVVHIGDSWRADVHGAQQMGMDVIWINRRQRSLPESAPPPMVIVSNIAEVLAYLAG